MYEIKRAQDPLPSDTTESVLAVLDKLAGEGVPPRLATFLQAIRLLRQTGASAEQVAAFEAKVKARLPLAEVFSPVEEKKKRRDAVEALKEEA